MNRARAVFVGIVLLSSLSAATAAGAQADAGHSSRPDRGSPGARARGLGGAFVAVADDATAMVSNPAGLSRLDQSEFSLHLGGENDDRSAARRTLSFAGAVMPVELAAERRLAVGLFYAKPLEMRQGAKNEILGVGAGLRWTPRFSAGLSIGLSTLDLLSEASRIEQENAAYLATGALWRLTDRVTLGASWQLGMRYETDLPGAVGGVGEEVFAGDFTIPSRGALGAAWRLTANWLVAAEIGRMAYSELGVAYEPHLGGQYALATGMGKWSVRGGWRRAVRPLEREYGAGRQLPGWPLRLEDTVHHLTAGAGWDVGRLAADLALDLSEAGNDVLLSFVCRPGDFRF